MSVSSPGLIVIGISHPPPNANHIWLTAHSQDRTTPPHFVTSDQIDGLTGSWETARYLTTDSGCRFKRTRFQKYNRGDNGPELRLQPHESTPKSRPRISVAEITAQISPTLMPIAINNPASFRMS